MTYGSRDPTVQHVHYVEKTGAHRLTMQASKRNTDSSLNAPVLCRFGEWFIGAFFFLLLHCISRYATVTNIRISTPWIASTIRKFMCTIMKQTLHMIGFMTSCDGTIIRNVNDSFSWLTTFSRACYVPAVENIGGSYYHMKRSFWHG